MDEGTRTPSPAGPHAADLRFVREVLDGDPAARGDFVTRMQCVPRFLHARNRRLGGVLGDEELADLTQDVLALVWRKLASFRGEAALETWVYRVSVFELMNRVRKRSARRAIGQDEAELHLEGAATEAPAVHDDVHRGLERIGPPESDVLRLKHFEELTFREIGARLELSANTAKTIYYRGLERLRALLGPERQEGGHV